MRDFAMCSKCGCYYPPADGHSAVICREIERWKWPASYRDRDAARQGGDANAAPVPKHGQARTEGIAQTQSEHVRPIP